MNIEQLSNICMLKLFSIFLQWVHNFETVFVDNNAMIKYLALIYNVHFYIVTFHESWATNFVPSLIKILILDYLFWKHSLVVNTICLYIKKMKIILNCCLSNSIVLMYLSETSSEDQKLTKLYYEQCLFYSN